MGELLIPILSGLVAAFTAYLGFRMTVRPVDPANTRALRRYEVAFIVLGILSVVLIAAQAVRGKNDKNQATAAAEASADARAKATITEMQKENQEILDTLHGLQSSIPPSQPAIQKPPASPPPTNAPVNSDAETARRRSMLLVLRNEYILSHDGISPALMAGAEWPPVDWMNQRLKELGERWAVAPGRTPIVLRIVQE